MGDCPRISCATAVRLDRPELLIEQAAEAFCDPFLRIVDASSDDEARDAIIGMEERWNLLFVVHIAFEDESVRLVSARKTTRNERRMYED